jgi:hypothetical protein
MYCKNKSKLNRQERRSLEKELNAKLAKRDSMNVEEKNLNDHINLLEIKLKTFSKDLRSCLLSLDLFLQYIIV